MTIEVALAFFFLCFGLYAWYKFINSLFDWLEYRKLKSLPDHSCKWFDCPMSDKPHVREDHGSWMPRR